MVLGLKIDEKIWPTKKCSGAKKLTSEKKKLVEGKRKLIDSLTGCNRVYPYMASQEVVLGYALAVGNKMTRSLPNFEDFFLSLARLIESSEEQLNSAS